MHRAVAAIALLLVPLTLPACGGDASGGTPSRKGAEVYAAQGCGLCHGPEGAGTSFGPELRGKARFWTRATIVEYLKAPVAYAEKDPRLVEQRKRYPLAMRAFDHVPEDELSAVADFVLGLP